MNNSQKFVSEVENVLFRFPHRDSPARSFILAKNRGRVSPSFFQANQVGHI